MREKTRNFTEAWLEDISGEGEPFKSRELSEYEREIFFCFAAQNLFQNIKDVEEKQRRQREAIANHFVVELCLAAEAEAFYCIAWRGRNGLLYESEPLTAFFTQELQKQEITRRFLPAKTQQGEVLFSEVF